MRLWSASHRCSGHCGSPVRSFLCIFHALFNGLLKDGLRISDTIFLSIMTYSFNVVPAISYTNESAYVQTKALAVLPPLLCFVSAR